MNERWRERVELYKRSAHRYERAARLHGCVAATLEAFGVRALAQRQRALTQLNRDWASTTQWLVGEFSGWSEPRVKSREVYEAAAIAHESVADVFDWAGMTRLAHAERQSAQDCRSAARWSVR